MNADILHQDMYAYDVYAEYLNKISYYSLNSNINSLSIRYYKQNIPLTKGTYDELDVIVNTYGRTYDIFDFAPVLQSTPLQYQVQNDETNQGMIRNTSGTLTMMAVIEPLPNDIFNFYQNGSTNEYFEVQSVNFVYSVKDLNLYEIQFETANWDKTSVEALNINEHYYYVKEFRKFYSSALYNDYSYLLENRNSILDEINNGYDFIKSYYTDSVEINNTTYDLNSNQILKLNSTLLYLNEKVKLGIKVVIGKKIEYDINGLVLKIDEIDTYVPDPNYIAPNIPDPNIPYDPYAGMVQSNIMKKVFDLQNIYYNFINYQVPLDGNVDTTGLSTATKTFKEDTVTVIKDLNGNTI